MTHYSRQRRPFTGAMTIGSLLLFLLGFAFYFAPWLVARSRAHRNAPAIAALNFFLGWTAIGWVVAFIWAYTDNTQPAQLPRPSVAPGGVRDATHCRRAGGGDGGLQRSRKWTHIYSRE